MSKSPSSSGASRALLLAVVAALAPVPARADPGVTALKAFHREGQTFLTWTEDDSAKGEWYKVYAAGEPITAENLERATFIARIPEGSREYRFLKDAPKRLKEIVAAGKWSAGIQLEDDDNAGKILPPGTGVFVRTIKKPGRACYAVTVERGGKEDTAVAAGVNSLKAPLAEAVETPGAIRLQKYDESYFAYLFFTDPASAREVAERSGDAAGLNRVVLNLRDDESHGPGANTLPYAAVVECAAPDLSTLESSLCGGGTNLLEGADLAVVTREAVLWNRLP